MSHSCSPDTEHDLICHVEDNKVSEDDVCGPAQMYRWAAGIPADTETIH